MEYGNNASKYVITLDEDVVAEMLEHAESTGITLDQVANRVIRTGLSHGAGPAERSIFTLLENQSQHHAYERRDAGWIDELRTNEQESSQ